MDRQRSNYLDNVKGILISLVVFSHFLLLYVDGNVAGLGLQTLYFFVFSFHIPLFVFVSGYLSKDLDKARDTAFSRLLVPYLIFNTLMLVFTYHTGRNPLTYLTPVLVNWYLLSLFFWRLCLKDLLRVRLLLPLSLLASLFVGYIGEVTNYLAISRTIAFLPFFLLGYYADEAVLRRIQNGRKLWAFLGLSFAALAVYGLTQRELLSTGLFTCGPFASGWDFILRSAFFALAVLIGLCVLRLTPQGKLLVLTHMGKHSLLIYLLHRYVTFIFHDFVAVEKWRDAYIILIIPSTLLTLLVLGQARLAIAYDAMIKALAGMFSNYGSAKTPSQQRRTVQLALIVILVINVIMVSVRLTPGRAQADDKGADIGQSTDPGIPQVLERQTQAELDDAITISFVGDLILLEDQVKHAYQPAAGQYDFSPVFEYAGPYLKESDFAIGVLELPVAGEEAGYSTSNYNDGIPLCLNAPDAWPNAIKAAGIDLVTTATNHALDKGRAGLARTIHYLESIHLSHVGTYLSQDHKVFVAQVQGLKIAFLAYSYGAKELEAEFDLAKSSHMMGVLAAPEDRQAFARSREVLMRDIERAKQHEPDVIIALPHMGTQFVHTADAFSRTWADTMLQAGVDVVLADHSHAVQPMVYRTTVMPDGTEKLGFILYCPGNFVNSYVERNGDASAMVNLHYARGKSGEGRLLGASIVPMWIHRTGNGQFCPLPIYEVFRNQTLRNRLSSLDMKRIEQVQALVTEVMLGQKLSLAHAQARYYYLPELGYVRPAMHVELTDKVQGPRLDETRQRLLEWLRHSEKTVILGDSISAGTRNGGYGWFEPLRLIFPDSQFISLSRGGETTRGLLQRSAQLAQERADVYILAIGVNDVRYRDPQRCAMNAAAYLKNMDKLIAGLQRARADTKIVLLSLWPAYGNDTISKLEPQARDAMIEAYNSVLKEFAAQKGHLYVDAYSPIRRYLTPRVTRDYIVDHIHPNANRGIKLYCNAVLFGAPDRWLIAMEPSGSELPTQAYTAHRKEPASPDLCP